MAVMVENLMINGKAFTRTYSNAGRCIIGGEPYAEYTEAFDPVEFGRTYTEGNLIVEDNEAQELLNILLDEQSQS